MTVLEWVCIAVTFIYIGAMVGAILFIAIDNFINEGMVYEGPDTSADAFRTDTPVPKNGCGAYLLIIILFLIVAFL